MSTPMSTTARGPPGWTPAIWDALNQAVNDEIRRTKVIDKMVAPVLMPDTWNVPADIPVPGTEGLTVKGDSIDLIETIVPIEVRKTQLHQEHQSSTAMTLATHAAALNAKTMDILFFQGYSKLKPSLGPTIGVNLNGNPGDGLLDKAAGKVDVKSLRKKGATGCHYGENTFSAVAEGIALLNKNGDYGPYELAFNPTEYADTYTPISGTLTTPKDGIVGLLGKNYYSTNALPEKTAVLLSVGGGAIDLPVAVPPRLEFTTINGKGSYCFVLREVSALRVKDEKDAPIIKLEFQCP